MIKRLRACFVLAGLAILVTMARSGHELPVYPSYYPHEIAVETVRPERAAGLLIENKIQAYVGGEPGFSGKVPASIHSVESLGSFVIIRLNPMSPSAKDPASACATVTALLRDIAGRQGFVFHPYPVTPFHGDYLFYADLAEAAKTRFLAALDQVSAQPQLRVKADGASSILVRPEWMTRGPEWDAAIEEVGAADLVASSMTSINGWLGPPWIKTGWFHAQRLLGDAIEDPEIRRRADALSERLKMSDYHDTVEQVSLQRQLLAELTVGCRTIMAGYTVKRQYFNAEFTDGIENIGFDSVAGFNSPMFLRTVKLKDFPWNGWLALGIDAKPDAAWNPVAGFGDPFGRLLWSAIGDMALLPSPYDSGWMLNRISDVQSNSAR